MLTVKQEDTEHKYSSAPLEWITMETNIAYWLHSSTNVTHLCTCIHTFACIHSFLYCDWLLLSQSQIHLIGNPVSWCVANVSLLAYQLLASVYLLRRRRGFKDLPEGTHTQTKPAQIKCFTTVSDG